MATNHVTQVIEWFQRDIREHKMTVLRYDGVYRHIVFGRPETSVYHFNLTTFPGRLVISGDMGTFVFARLPDMFDFFRRDSEEYERIDLRYWAEKCEAADKSSGIKSYSREVLNQVVTDRFEEFIAEHELSDEERAAIKEQCDDAVYTANDRGIDIGVDALRAIYWKGHDVFPDPWEYDVDDYTTRFVWCCCAISWGVQQYDAWCAAKVTAAPLRPRWMRACVWAKRYGDKLVGATVDTKPMGEWPGGLSEVIEMHPDPGAPEIVFRVKLLEGHRAGWDIGVFKHEPVRIMKFSKSMETP